MDAKTVNFKSSSTSGISENNKQLLINYLSKIKLQFKNEKIMVFATAVFRKISEIEKQLLVDRIFIETGLKLNIISQDLESHFLETALLSNCNLNYNILLINVGGGSTQLIVVKKNKIIEKINLDIGVNSVLSKFPEINNAISKYPLNKVTRYIKSLLPKIEIKTPLAIYSGGELTYMKLTKYKLCTNIFFEDENQTHYISMDNFSKRNLEIFSSVKLEQLENLMPDNPIWMHGARACAAIAQAIFEVFKIQNIIPSDCCISHGIEKKQYSNVVISSGFSDEDFENVNNIKQNLKKLKIIILSSRFNLFKNTSNKNLLETERFHINQIKKCDALIVCCLKGNVSSEVFFDIGFANAFRKRIIFTEKPKNPILNIFPHEIL